MTIRSNRLVETIRTNGHTIGFGLEMIKLEFGIPPLSVPRLAYNIYPV